MFVTHAAKKTSAPVNIAHTQPGTSASSSSDRPNLQTILAGEYISADKKIDLLATMTTTSVAEDSQSITEYIEAGQQEINTELRQLESSPGLILTEETEEILEDLSRQKRVDDQLAFRAQLVSDAGLRTLCTPNNVVADCGLQSCSSFLDGAKEWFTYIENNSNATEHLNKVVLIYDADIKKYNIATGFLPDHVVIPPAQPCKIKEYHCAGGITYIHLEKATPQEAESTYSIYSGEKVDISSIHENLYGEYSTNYQGVPEQKEPYALKSTPLSTANATETKLPAQATVENPEKSAASYIPTEEEIEQQITQSWEPSNFTDPAQYVAHQQKNDRPPENYKFIIHTATLDDLINSRGIFSEDAQKHLENWDSISASVISDNHNISYRSVGVILKVPANNIVAMHSQDMMSELNIGVLERTAHLVNVYDKDNEKNKYLQMQPHERNALLSSELTNLSRNRKTVDELLAYHGRERNELIVITKPDVKIQRQTGERVKNIHEGVMTGRVEICGYVLIDNEPSESQKYDAKILKRKLLSREEKEVIYKNKIERLSQKNNLPVLCIKGQSDIAEVMSDDARKTLLEADINKYANAESSDSEVEVDERTRLTDEIINVIASGEFPSDQQIRKIFKFLKKMPDFVGRKIKLYSYQDAEDVAEISASSERDKNVSVIIRRGNNLGVISPGNKNLTVKPGKDCLYRAILMTLEPDIRTKIVNSSKLNLEQSAAILKQKLIEHIKLTTQQFVAHTTPVIQITTPDELSPIEICAQEIRKMGSWQHQYADIAPLLLTYLPEMENISFIINTSSNEPPVEITARNTTNYRAPSMLYLRNEHYNALSYSGRPVYTKPDGDCFYHAVLATLTPDERERVVGRTKGSESVQILRNKLADLVLQHRERVEPFITGTAQSAITYRSDAKGNRNSMISLASTDSTLSSSLYAEDKIDTLSCSAGEISSGRGSPISSNSWTAVMREGVGGMQLSSTSSDHILWDQIQIADGLNQKGLCAGLVKNVIHCVNSYRSLTFQQVISEFIEQQHTDDNFITTLNMSQYHGPDAHKPYSNIEAIAESPRSFQNYPDLKNSLAQYHLEQENENLIVELFFRSVSGENNHVIALHCDGRGKEKIYEIYDPNNGVFRYKSLSEMLLALEHYYEYREKKSTAPLETSFRPLLVKENVLPEKRALPMPVGSDSINVSAASQELTVDNEPKPVRMHSAYANKLISEALLDSIQEGDAIPPRMEGIISSVEILSEFRQQALRISDRKPRQILGKNLSKDLLSKIGELTDELQYNELNRNGQQFNQCVNLLIDVDPYDMRKVMNASPTTLDKYFTLLDYAVNNELVTAETLQRVINYMIGSAHKIQGATLLGSLMIARDIPSETTYHADYEWPSRAWSILYHAAKKCDPQHGVDNVINAMLSNVWKGYVKPATNKSSQYVKDNAYRAIFNRYGRWSHSGGRQQLPKELIPTSEQIKAQGGSSNFIKYMAIVRRNAPEVLAPVQNLSLLESTQRDLTMIPDTRQRMFTVLPKLLHAKQCEDAEAFNSYASALLPPLINPSQLYQMVHSAHDRTDNTLGEYLTVLNAISQDPLTSPALARKVIHALIGSDSSILYLGLRYNSAPWMKLFWQTLYEAIQKYGYTTPSEITKYLFDTKCALEPISGIRSLKNLLTNKQINIYDALSVYPHTDAMKRIPVEFLPSERYVRINSHSRKTYQNILDLHRHAYRVAGQSAYKLDDVFKSFYPDADINDPLASQYVTQKKRTFEDYLLARRQEEEKLLSQHYTMRTSVAETGWLKNDMVSTHRQLLRTDLLINDIWSEEMRSYVPSIVGRLLRCNIIISDEKGNEDSFGGQYPINVKLFASGEGYLSESQLKAKSKPTSFFNAFISALPDDIQNRLKNTLKSNIGKYMPHLDPAQQLSRLISDHITINPATVDKLAEENIPLDKNEKKYLATLISRIAHSEPYSQKDLDISEFLYFASRVFYNGDSVDKQRIISVLHNDKFIRDLFRYYNKPGVMTSFTGLLHSAYNMDSSRPQNLLKLLAGENNTFIKKIISCPDAGALFNIYVKLLDKIIHDYAQQQAPSDADNEVNKIKQVIRQRWLHNDIYNAFVSKKRRKDFTEMISLLSRYGLSPTKEEAFSEYKSRKYDIFRKPLKSYDRITTVLKREVNKKREVDSEITQRGLLRYTQQHFHTSKIEPQRIQRIEDEAIAAIKNAIKEPIKEEVIKKIAADYFREADNLLRKYPGNAAAREQAEWLRAEGRSPSTDIVNTIAEQLAQQVYEENMDEYIALIQDELMSRANLLLFNETWDDERQLMVVPRYGSYISTSEQFSDIIRGIVLRPSPARHAVNSVRPPDVTAKVIERVKPSDLGATPSAPTLVLRPPVDGNSELTAFQEMESGETPAHGQTVSHPHLKEKRIFPSPLNTLPQESDPVLQTSSDEVYDRPAGFDWERKAAINSTEDSHRGNQSASGWGWEYPSGSNALLQPQVWAASVSMFDLPPIESDNPLPETNYVWEWSNRHNIAPGTPADQIRIPHRNRPAFTSATPSVSAKMLQTNEEKNNFPPVSEHDRIMITAAIRGGYYEHPTVQKYLKEHLDDADSLARLKPGKVTFSENEPNKLIKVEKSQISAGLSADVTLQTVEQGKSISFGTSKTIVLDPDTGKGNTDDQKEFSPSKFFSKSSGNKPLSGATSFHAQPEKVTFSDNAPNVIGTLYNNDSRPANRPASDARHVLNTTDVAGSNNVHTLNFKHRHDSATMSGDLLSREPGNPVPDSRFHRVMDVSNTPDPLFNKKHPAYYDPTRLTIADLVDIPDPGNKHKPDPMRPTLEDMAFIPDPESEQDNQRRVMQQFYEINTLGGSASESRKFRHIHSAKVAQEMRKTVFDGNNGAERKMYDLTQKFTRMVEESNKKEAHKTQAANNKQAQNIVSEIRAQTESGLTRDIIARRKGEYDTLQTVDKINATSKTKAEAMSQAETALMLQKEAEIISASSQLAGLKDLHEERRLRYADRLAKEAEAETADYGVPEISSGTTAYLQNRRILDFERNYEKLTSSLETSNRQIGNTAQFNTKIKSQASNLVASQLRDVITQKSEENHIVKKLGDMIEKEVQEQYETIKEEQEEKAQQAEEKAKEEEKEKENNEATKANGKRDPDPDPGSDPKAGAQALKPSDKHDETWQEGKAHLIADKPRSTGPGQERKDLPWAKDVKARYQARNATGDKPGGQNPALNSATATKPL